MIVREMDAAFDRPDQPISHGYLNTLELLAFKTRRPDLKSPRSREEMTDPNRRQAAQARYRDAKQQVHREYVVRLGKTLASKTGAALATSIQTFMALLDPRNEAADPELAKLATAARAQLSGILQDLPPREQRELLDYRWDAVDGQAVLPALLKTYAGLPVGRSYEESARRDVVLRRICELSPDEGRRLIIGELRRPTNELNVQHLQALMMLPDKTLPGLDEAWAGALSSHEGPPDKQVAARLLARYGTGAMLPRVKEFYRGKVEPGDAGLQAPLLAYFLRVDEPFGIYSLRETLSRRIKDQQGHELSSHYYPAVLRDVSVIYTCRAMEKVADEFLEDNDPAVAAGAAEFLQAHGSSAAKPLLFSRLERWHEQWRGRQSELGSTVSKGNQHHHDEWLLEQSLVYALSEADARRLDGAEVNRLRSLCVTEDCLRQLDTAARAPGTKIPITLWRASQEEFRARVDNYNATSLDRVKSRMSQYPKGTIFVLSNGGVRPDDLAKLLAEIRTFAESQGMALEG